MNAQQFVEALADVQLASVFNPYRDRCVVHDVAEAPWLRRRNLQSYLEAIEKLGADTIWMGRDLGYRGGRRTGLALTDEAHLREMAAVYPGCAPSKATRGQAVAERTAAEIWSFIERLKRPPLLWNVFPFHPHEADDPFTNRKFTRAELCSVTALNSILVSWLGIERVVCIGQDAATYAADLGVEVLAVRHPSYGGVSDFRKGMTLLYPDAGTAASTQGRLALA